MMEEKLVGLQDWFHVSCNNDGFNIDKQASGYDHHVDHVLWGDIIRICFVPAEYFFDQDEIYIFTKHQPESYLIPLETDGALELWHMIIELDLFDAKLAIKAACSSGGLFVWPPNEENH